MVDALPVARKQRTGVMVEGWPITRMRSP